MAIWLVRAGKHAEYELKFLQEKRIYVTWDKLDVDLKKLSDQSELTIELTKRYSDAKVMAIANWIGQIWPFAHEMKISDLVIVPLKKQRAFQIGEITGDYHFEKKGPSPYFHWRSVKWISENVPRTNFGKDLLFALGNPRTICRIQSHNAETRLDSMRKNIGR